MCPYIVSLVLPNSFIVTQSPISPNDTHNTILHIRKYYISQYHTFYTLLYNNAMHHTVPHITLHTSITLTQCYTSQNNSSHLATFTQYQSSHKVAQRHIHTISVITQSSTMSHSHKVMFHTISHNDTTLYHTKQCITISHITPIDLH